MPRATIRTYGKNSSVSYRRDSRDALNALFAENLLKREICTIVKKKPRKGRRILLKDLPPPDENHHLIEDSWERSDPFENTFDKVFKSENFNMKKNKLPPPSSGCITRSKNGGKINHHLKCENTSDKSVENSSPYVEKLIEKNKDKEFTTLQPPTPISCVTRSKTGTKLNHDLKCDKSVEKFKHENKNKEFLTLQRLATPSSGCVTRSKNSSDIKHALKCEKTLGESIVDSLYIEKVIDKKKNKEVTTLSSLLDQTEDYNLPRIDSCNDNHSIEHSYDSIFCKPFVGNTRKNIIASTPAVACSTPSKQVSMVNETISPITSNAHKSIVDKSYETIHTWDYKPPKEFELSNRLPSSCISTPKHKRKNLRCITKAKHRLKKVSRNIDTNKIHLQSSTNLSSVNDEKLKLQPIIVLKSMHEELDILGISSSVKFPSDVQSSIQYTRETNRSKKTLIKSFSKPRVRYLELRGRKVPMVIPTVPCIEKSNNLESVLNNLKALTVSKNDSPFKRSVIEDCNNEIENNSEGDDEEFLLERSVMDSIDKLQEFSDQYLFDEKPIEKIQSPQEVNSLNNSKDMIIKDIINNSEEENSCSFDSLECGKQLLINTNLVKPNKSLDFTKFSKSRQPHNNIQHRWTITEFSNLNRSTSIVTSDVSQLLDFSSKNCGKKLCKGDFLNGSICNENSTNGLDNLDTEIKVNELSNKLNEAGKKTSVEDTTKYIISSTAIADEHSGLLNTEPNNIETEISLNCIRNQNISFNDDCSNATNLLQSSDIGRGDVEQNASEENSNEHNSSNLKFSNIRNQNITFNDDWSNATNLLQSSDISTGDIEQNASEENSNEHNSSNLEALNDSVTTEHLYSSTCSSSMFSDIDDCPNTNHLLQSFGIISEDIQQNINEECLEQHDLSNLMCSPVIEERLDDSVSDEHSYCDNESLANDSKQQNIDNKFSVNISISDDEEEIIWISDQEEVDCTSNVKNKRTSYRKLPHVGASEEIVDILSSEDDVEEVSNTEELLDTSTTSSMANNSLNSDKFSNYENMDIQASTVNNSHLNDVNRPFKTPIRLNPGKSWRRSLLQLRRNSLYSQSTNCIAVKGCICGCSKCKPCDSRKSIQNERIPKDVSVRSTLATIRQSINCTILALDHSNTSIAYGSNDTRETVFRERSIGKSFELTRNNSIYEETPNERARSIVLRKCGQETPIPFNECYTPTTLKRCHKIGEGVYGEVFIRKNLDGSGTVMKIIPIEGDQLVNSEPQKKFSEILSEIIIAMELSNLRHNTKNNTDGFSELKSVKCVQGRYPGQLLYLWDLYDDMHKSSNDSPEMFNDDQLFIILELANGGMDMESFVFKNADEAISLYTQIAYTLAVAEQACQFEHRDLHWGNVLISRTNKNKELNYCLNGRDFYVPSNGIEVSIIDFTLSRILINNAVVYNDISKEPDLFTSSGDYQFEIYKLMQQRNNNDWEHYESYSNILWMHYIVHKMITELKYSNIGTKLHKAAMQKLINLENTVLKYNSVYELVDNELN